MPVVFLIAIAAVLVGVFYTATGRGGELAIEHADHAPLDLGPVSAADIALLRPPTALWGYNMQVTDEALDHIARAMRDRDVTIARLRQQLVNRDLMEPVARPTGAPLTRADARRPLEVPRDPAAPQPPMVSPDPTPPQPVMVSREPNAPQPAAVPSEPEDPQTINLRRPPGILVASRSQEVTQPREIPQPAESTPSSEVTQPREIPQPAGFEQPSPGVQPRAFDQSSEVTLPREAIQPPETMPLPEATRPGETTQPSEITQPAEVRGPQGSYDTHDWWAGQGEAARDEARQTGPQPVIQPRLREPDAAAAGATEAGATEAGATEAGATEAGSPWPATPADDAPSPTEERSW